MKIPKKLRINGFDWEVKESQEIANEGQAFGSTHYEEQKIFLEPKATKQKKEQVLLHEILHAIWWECGLAQRYKKDKPEVEEEIITALSHGLYQVLVDNKLLK